MVYDPSAMTVEIWEPKELGKDFATTEEVSAVAGVERASLYEWVREGLLPAPKTTGGRGIIAKWPLSTLVIAKFVPGFSTVAPPIAGSLRMALPGFLLAAAAGAALWAGLALGVGWLLRSEVQAAIAALDKHTGNALVVVAGVLLVWLSWKLWQKYRFRQLSAVPHITPGDLMAAMAAEYPPLVLDLRGHSMVATTGPIIGTTIAEHDRLLDAVGDWPKDRPIVTLCACPEDAGAVHAARNLLKEGYLSVRPLKGGYDAWLATLGEKSA